MFASYADAVHMTGLSRPSIDRLIKANGFPKPVTLMPRRIAFVRAELEAWMRARTERRDAGHAEQRAA